MDGNNPIELLRECAVQDHGMARLRDALCVGLEAGWQQRCLDRLADEIESAYMRLPVDADGVPIRVGDEIEYPNGRRDVVRFITINDNLPTFNESGWVASKCRHVKPETIEGIIAEAMSLACEPEAPYSTNSTLVKNYAERIRKAVL